MLILLVPYIRYSRGSQPFVTGIPPNQYWTPLRTPKSILNPLMYAQNHCFLSFVSLFWYDLKFWVPTANWLRIPRGTHTPGWELLSYSHQRLQNSKETSMTNFTT
jgi:hypothetical protein